MTWSETRLNLRSYSDCIAFSSSREVGASGKMEEFSFLCREHSAKIVLENCKNFAEEKKLIFPLPETVLGTEALASISANGCWHGN